MISLIGRMGKGSLSPHSDANGSETGRVDFTYDGNGNTVGGYETSELVPHWDSDGNLEPPATDPMVGAVELTYGAPSGMAGDSYYDNGNIQFEYQYDGDRQLGWKHYYSSGELMEYAVFEYDSQGRRLKYSYYGADDVLRQVTDFEYPEHKSIETTTVYYSTGGEQVTRQIETEYGGNDKIVRRATTVNEGSIMLADGPLEVSHYTEETYNSDGQILLQERYVIKNGEKALFVREEYTYE